MKGVVTTDLYHKQIEPITVVIIFLTQESQEAVLLKIVFITLKDFKTSLDLILSVKKLLILGTGGADNGK